MYRVKINLLDGGNITWDFEEEPEHYVVENQLCFRLGELAKGIGREHVLYWESYLVSDSCITLKSTGERRIAVIKSIRQHTGWDLKRAKEASDNLVTISEQSILGSTADFANDLRACGATVVVDG